MASGGGGREAAGGRRWSAAAAEEEAMSEGSSSMELTDTDEAAAAAANGKAGAAAAAYVAVGAAAEACQPSQGGGGHRGRRSHTNKSGSCSSGGAAASERRRRRSSSGYSRATSGAGAGEGESGSSSDSSGITPLEQQGGETAATAAAGDRSARDSERARRKQKRSRRRHSAAGEEKNLQQEPPANGGLRMEGEKGGGRGEQQQQQRGNVGREKRHRKKRKHRSSSDSSSGSNCESSKEAAGESSSSVVSSSLSCPPPPWRRHSSNNRSTGGGAVGSCLERRASSSSSSSSVSDEGGRNGSSSHSLRQRVSSSDSSMSYSSRESSRGRGSSGGQHSEGSRGTGGEDDSSSSRSSSRGRSRGGGSALRPETMGSDSSSSRRRRGEGRRKRRSSSASGVGGGDSSSSSHGRRRGRSSRRRKKRSSSKGREGECHRGEQLQATAVSGAAAAADLEMQLLALQQEIAEANMQRIQQQEEALKAFLAQPDDTGSAPCGAIYTRSDEEVASSKAEGNSENGENSDPEFNADDLVGERIEILESQQVTVELVETTKGAGGASSQQEQKALPVAIQTVDEGEKCLHPSIISNMRRCGFRRLMPVQKFAFPIAGAGFDVCGMAQTGSGKTLAFVAPMLSQLLRAGSVFRPFFPGSRAQASPLGLILVPTRELALQIGDEIERMTRQTQLHHVVLAGGCAAKEQAALINQQQVDVAVCTPGRLEDLCDMCKVCLEFVQILVLDEADAMLDLGFRDKIVALVNDRDMPKERQTLLFSATYAEELMSLIPTFLRTSYVRLTVGPPGDGAALHTGSAPQGPAVKQILKLVGSEAKLAALLEDLEKFMKTQKVAALAQNNVSPFGAPSAAGGHKSAETAHQAIPAITATAALAAPAETNAVPGAAGSPVPGSTAGVTATTAGVTSGINPAAVRGSGAAGTTAKTAAGPSVPGVNFQQQQVIVFVNSKRDVFPTVHALRLRGISVDGLSGSMSREARRQVYHDFKARRFQIMVATSLAARGLDFLDVSLVINYDVPTQAETYLHRIGRTGRLGRTGTAITYVCRRDRKVAPALVKILKKTGEAVPGFLELMARESGELET